jgi:hypothetical protein
MKTPNPYQSPADTETSQEPPAETISKTLRGAAWQGVRLGWKWTTIILGPIALLVLLASVGLTIYLLAVRGPVIFTDPELRWETLKRLGSPFGFYIACCVWGIIAGLLVCVPLHLLRRIARQRTADSTASDDTRQPPTKPHQATH